VSGSAKIPVASDSNSGVINTIEQSFLGDKTFKNNVIINDTLTVDDNVTLKSQVALGDAYADNITLKGRLIGTLNVTYGTNDPSKLTSPTAGQIYFKIIN
jgi:hypothetical protein